MIKDSSSSWCPRFLESLHCLQMASGFLQEKLSRKQPVFPLYKQVIFGEKKTGY